MSEDEPRRSWPRIVPRVRTYPAPAPSEVLSYHELVILRALRNEGSMTADEFVISSNRYVNSWAPVFTHLRAVGFAVFINERRKTAHGGWARVTEITPEGRTALEEAP